MSEIQSFLPEVKKTDPDSLKENKNSSLYRNLTAFWILGLCNNFGYVVMLTAAHDIIHDLSITSPENQSDPEFKRNCHKMSAGAILLADIFPALCVKLIAPFVPFYIFCQITICIVLSVVSFVLVAYAKVAWFALIGVVLTSISAGLGEVTLLSYTSRFNKNSVSTWSSGTGGAGIFGSFCYTAMTQAGLSTKRTLLIMVIVPFVEAIVFVFLLEHPKSENESRDTEMKRLDVESDCVIDDFNFKDKLQYIPSLFKYIIPLFLGNICDNLINQAFSELIYFENIFIDQKAQYRWYQVTYQIGVFISRSSVNLFKVRWLWLMAVLQGINVVLFAVEAVFWVVPSIWIVFGFILWEGLLGGGAYVNTFYRISEEILPSRKMFALSITAFSKTGGIALAGFLAMPTHNAICKVPIPIRGL